jgi:hypothetical protein
LVRMIISILDSSPSTSCLLDRLPLSPSDIRMAFEVFVGSNGQIMMKTIAGLLSELTTGPDTRAFLESVMGMMSIFKRYHTTIFVAIFHTVTHIRLPIQRYLRSV